MRGGCLILVSFLVAAALLLAVPALAAADTYCVNDPGCVSGGGTSEPGLQDALNAASGNAGDDTVRIGAGTYKGQFQYTGGNGAVDVVGAGTSQTTITDNPSTLSQTVFLLYGPGSSIHRLTVSLPTSSPSDIGGDYGLVLSNSATATKVRANGPNSDNGTAVWVTDSTLKDSTVNVPPDAPEGDRGVLAYGTSTIADTSITAVTGIAQSSTGQTTSVRRVSIDPGGQGIQTDDGTVDVRDSFIDLGTGVGTVGLDGQNPNGGGPLDIVANHVTIVGGGSGSIGFRVAADASVNNGSQTAMGELDNSVISGPATSLYRDAGNPSPNNPGTNTADLTVSYSNYEAVHDVNGAHGAGTISYASDVPGTPKFVDPAHGNFRPTRKSILVDSGDPTFIPLAGEKDLDGGPRVRDGNKDGTAVTDVGAYERENVRPTVDITKVKTPGHSAKVSFTATDATGIASTECKVDSKPYAPCSSPKTFKGLSDGRHTVTVKATDLYANVGTDKQAFKVG